MTNPLARYAVTALFLAACTTPRRGDAPATLPPTGAPSSAVASPALSSAPAPSASPAPSMVSPRPEPPAVPRQALEFRRHEIEVTLEPEPGEHRTGEPWALVFRVRNRSGVPIFVVDGGDYRNRMGRPTSYHVQAMLGGVPIEVIDAGPVFGGLSGPHPIAPGAAYEKKLLVPRWLDLRTPGSYLFSVDKVLQLGDGPSESFRDRKLDARPAQVSVRVDVSASTPESVGAVIDALGARVMSDDQDDAREAANRLDFVEDERAIAPYAAAVMKWAQADPDRQVVLESIHALGKWRSRRAFDAAVFALGSTRDYLHLAAAQAIEAQGLPQGLPVLWALRDDRDNLVRVVVTHFVDAQNPPDVVERLRTMAADKDSMVSEEARRLLQKRGAAP